MKDGPKAGSDGEAGTLDHHSVEECLEAGSKEEAGTLEHHSVEECLEAGSEGEAAVEEGPEAASDGDPAEDAVSGALSRTRTAGLAGHSDELRRMHCERPGTYVRANDLQRCQRQALPQGASAQHRNRLVPCGRQQIRTPSR